VLLAKNSDAQSTWENFSSRFVRCLLRVVKHVLSPLSERVWLENTRSLRVRSSAARHPPSVSSASVEKRRLLVYRHNAYLSRLSFPSLGVRILCRARYFSFLWYIRTRWTLSWDDERKKECSIHMRLNAVFFFQIIIVLHSYDWKKELHLMSSII